MKNIFTVLVSFLLFCFLIQSCAESDCSLSTTSLAHFDFLDSKSHQPVELTEGAMITGIITVGASNKNIRKIFLIKRSPE